MYSLKSKSGIFGTISRYFQLLELAFWTAFVFWVCGILFSTSPYLEYINYLLFTAVVVLFVWFFMRDYIAGIQLKSRYNFFNGQAFKSTQITGVIRKTSLLYIEIKGENGSDFRIPYSQIEQKSIELNVQEKSGGENLIVVALDQNLNEEDTIQKIIELVVNSPWSSHKSSPMINVQEPENGLKTYEISCIINGEHSAKRLKELIEKEVGKKKRHLTKRN